MVKVTDEIRDVFHALIEEAEKQVKLNPTAGQVVVVKTAKGNTYTCVNNNTYTIENGVIMSVGDFDEEIEFIQMLVDIDDVEVKYIVCMWQSGSVEIPSYHFRNGILEICSKNQEAIWVGQGEDCLLLRALKDTVPAKE